MSLALPWGGVAPGLPWAPHCRLLRMHMCATLVVACHSLTLPLHMWPRRLCGTLDYVGQADEGIKVGTEAVDAAKTLLSQCDHPITAMCMGALGYNLRNGKQLQVRAKAGFAVAGSGRV